MKLILIFFIWLLTVVGTVSVSVLTMIHGFGLEPQSWPIIIFGYSEAMTIGAVGGIIISIIGGE